jgi:hypothetical protein
MQFLKDIPFNFLIGDDGFVYEGRGFRFQGEIASNDSTSSFDDIGIFVAFIGTFSNQQPSEGQVTTFNRFLELSTNRDVLMRNYTLLLQDQLSLEYPLKAFAEGLRKLLDQRDDATLCERLDIFIELLLILLPLFSNGNLQ